MIDMKLGIVGSGGIVKDVLIALKPINTVKIQAIWVRPHSEAKGQALAQENNIPQVYTDYEAFLEQADIDTVYIGLVNSAHYEYAKKALLAGRNVIVEKPFGSNLREVQDLVQLAKEKNLFLWEAVSLLHMPNFHKLQELLPKLEPIRMVQANYSQYSSRYDKYLEGTVLFGAPNSLVYQARKGFNGIDTSGVVLMSYPEFQALAIGAKDSGSPSTCLIQGEKGWLKVETAPNQLEKITCQIRGEDNIQEYALNQYPHRLSHEFAAFAAMLANKDFAARDLYLHISLQVAETAEQARKQAGISFPADQQAPN